MAFDRGDVDRALDDIQKYLGYLKGNEQAYGYLERTWNQMVTRTNEPGIHVRQVMLRPDYRPPCPEERFRVNFTTWWHPVLCYPGGQEPDLKAYADEVQHQTDLAYGEGVAWAAGIAGYLRSICAQFVEPDVAVLREAVLDLQSKVVARLDDVLNDDWALLGSANEKWNGAAAGAFNSFYDNYNETLGRSGHFAGMVAIGFASATRVIESAQAGLQDFLDKTRDGLVEQTRRVGGQRPEARVPSRARDVPGLGGRPREGRRRGAERGERRDPGRDVDPRSSGHPRARQGPGRRRRRAHRRRPSASGEGVPGGVLRPDLPEPRRYAPRRLSGWLHPSDGPSGHGGGRDLLGSLAGRDRGVLRPGRADRDEGGPGHRAVGPARRTGHGADRSPRPLLRPAVAATRTTRSGASRRGGVPDATCPGAGPWPSPWQSRALRPWPSR
ncbi:hypothetical protein G5V59_03805 [Nocardioides sp. W3-2-3]|uniref:hypothetical protein n=1 Tax=Nocardioides convexus TaxID=2712224 RepID=UPI0024187109|nr:hypothetical protein [Nocardioides convexus]NGZ99762.1 hypothetical protein [Nocardioides convexus]